MTLKNSISPDSLGLGAAAAAVVAGSLLLVVAGAPARMPLMNLAALGIGFAALMILRLLARAPLGGRAADVALLAASAAVPLTAVFGANTDGVSRWVLVAGITIQPALIVVPPVIIAFARRQSGLRLAALACAAVGVALQPDAGAATMLALGAAAPLVARHGAGAKALAGAAVGTAALLVAGLRGVALPPVPFVENVLADALGAGAGTALLAAAAVGLMLSPALLLRSAAPPAVLLAFAGVWVGALAASLAGAYPTPVVGSGGSAILGYILSIGMVGNRLLRPSRAVRSNPAAADPQAGPETMKFA